MTICVLGTFIVLERQNHFESVNLIVASLTSILLLTTISSNWHSSSLLAFKVYFKKFALLEKLEKQFNFGLHHCWRIGNLCTFKSRFKKNFGLNWLLSFRDYPFSIFYFIFISLLLSKKLMFGL